MGGCRTETRDFGLPAYSDSLAETVVRALLAPRPGGGRPGSTPPGATPLFVQIGSVDSLGDPVWQAIAAQVTGRLQRAGASIGRRTALLKTTGPCFPPYHVDFEGWADSSDAAAFLDSLAVASWEGFAPVERRSARSLFVQAGTSLQQLDRVIDLRRVPR